MTSSRIITFCFSAILFSLVLNGCVSPQGGSVTEKRATAQQMRSDVLASLYKTNPQVRNMIATAPGYGVFSGMGTQTIFVSTGQGWGIIRDNATGKDMYMSAVKLGGGLGLGVVDVRAVVVFHDRQTMINMIEQGWTASGKGDAAAKVGETGGAGAAVISLPGMSIYRFTENGVMLGGALEGAKVWKDAELN